MKLSILATAVLSLILTSGCTSPGKKTAIGAGVGAAAGAAAGAIIGHQSGKRGKGALIGAALGGALGGTYGNRLDKQAKELAQYAETKRTDDGIVTRLKGDILFDSGVATVKPAARSRIKEISKVLKKYPENVITVIGHSDSLGKASDNQRLSEQRARAVRLVMLSAGVPKGSVSSVGMGESQPISSNKTRAGRARNRRVELQITVDESKIQ